MADVKRWLTNERGIWVLPLEGSLYLLYLEEGGIKAAFKELSPGLGADLVPVIEDLKLHMKEIAFDAEAKATRRDPYAEEIRAVVSEEFQKNPKGYQGRVVSRLTKKGITPPMPQRMSEMVKHLKPKK